MTLLQRVVSVLFWGGMAVFTACVIMGDFSFITPWFLWLGLLAVAANWIPVIQLVRRRREWLKRKDPNTREADSKTTNDSKASEAASDREHVMANLCRSLEECLRLRDRASRDFAFDDLVAVTTCGLCALSSFVAGMVTGEGFQLAWAAVMAFIVGFTAWSRWESRKALEQSKGRWKEIETHLERIKARFGAR